MGCFGVAGDAAVSAAVVGIGNVGAASVAAASDDGAVGCIVVGSVPSCR